MAWIESHQALRNHPKLADLSAILGIMPVHLTGHLHWLWWWCMDYAMDGDIGKYSDQQIAAGAGWTGDPHEFMMALIKSKFIDQDDRGRKIHDWLDFCGAVIGKRLERQNKRQTTADNGGQRRTTADNGGQNPPTNQPTNQPTEEHKPGPEIAESVPLAIAGLSLYRTDRRLLAKWADVWPAWVSAYPAVNMVAEIAKAHAWEVSNPERRKKDRVRFLARWFARVQDNGGTPGYHPTQIRACRPHIAAFEPPPKPEDLVPHEDVKRLLDDLSRKKIIPTIGKESP